jgi:hypothetical protein
MSPFPTHFPPVPISHQPSPDPSLPRPQSSPAFPDVNSLFNDVIANASLYGFSNATDAALPSGSNGNGFLFWDTVHPTTQADQIIAGIAAQSVPDPDSVVRFGSALVLVACWARRRRPRRLDPER